MKFRKKPVVIEAVQLTKELRNNMGPFPEWALPHLDASRTGKIENSEEIYIINPSGRLRVFDGDWIIRGTKEGDVYPCPDDVFQATYDPSSSAMSFGAAIEAMKSGEKVSRVGWNGKGMHISCIKPLGSYAFDTDHAMMLEPFLLIKNVKGTYNTWVPSISDCLAEDWGVVE